MKVLKSHNFKVNTEVHTTEKKCMVCELSKFAKYLAAQK